MSPYLEAGPQGEVIGEHASEKRDGKHQKHGGREPFPVPHFLLHDGDRRGAGYKEHQNDEKRQGRGVADDFGKHREQAFFSHAVKDAEGRDGIFLRHDTGQQGGEQFPVQPQRPADGLQQTPDPRQNAGFNVATRQVGQNPYHNGYRQDDGPRLFYEGNRPRPHDKADGAEVGRVIQGQLHDERHGLVLQDEPVDENARRPQSQNVHGQKRPRYQGCLRKKHGPRDKCEDGEPGRARNKRREENGQQSFFFRLHDSCAEYGRHIASETETQRQEALPVEPHEVHESVHDESGPRHVAHVFEKGEDGEENDENRQESQYRSRAADNPVNENPSDPGIRGAEHMIDPSAECADACFEQFLQGEADLVGEEKDARKYGKKNRNPEQRPGQDVIDAVRHYDLPHLESGNGCPGSFLDPVVSAADHGMQRVFVLDKQGLNFAPVFWRNKALYHC